VSEAIEGNGKLMGDWCLFLVGLIKENRVVFDKGEKSIKCLGSDADVEPKAVWIIRLVAAKHKSNLAAFRHLMGKETAGAEELNEEAPNAVGGKEMRAAEL
jgi:hypothetical protein